MRGLFLVFVILLLLLLFSCKSKSKVFISVAKNDSIVIRDSVVRILERDTILQKIAVECDSSGVMVVDYNVGSSKYARPFFRVSGKTIESGCIIDSASVVIRWFENHRYTKEVATQQGKEKTTKWMPTSFVDKIFLFLGYAFSVFFVFFLILRKILD